MNPYLKIFLVTLTIPVATVAMMAMTGMGDDNGIIAYDDFAEGVVLCTTEADTEPMVISGGTTFIKDGLHVTINDGFENDPRVGKLLELAARECEELRLRREAAVPLAGGVVGTLLMKLKELR